MEVLHQFVLLTSCLALVNGLMFRLPQNNKRCVKEEVHKGVLVSGEFELNEGAGRVDLLVTDTKGHILVSREKVTNGKFAFVTDDYDVFEACFTSKLEAGQRGSDREVTLALKHGVEAKTYDAMSDVGKLKPLELELQKLEDLSESIVKDFAYMRQREAEMRDTNESTNTRVLYFSIFSMCCLLGLATWQVLYLRRFFKAKKLIE